MKYPCGLIQDLLPLYVENMTGEESNAAVEAHLAECPDCKKALEGLSRKEKVPRPEVVPLAMIKKRISARKWKTVAAAVCILLAAGLSVFYYLICPHYLLYSEGLVTIEEQEDGGLHIEINEPTSGAMLNGGISGYELEVSQSHIGNMEGAEFTLSSEQAEGARIYYIDYRHEDVLIYGEPEDGERMTLPRLAMNYYLLIAGGLAVLLGIGVLCFSKKKAGKVLFAVWLAPACYIAGHLCIKGFYGVTASLPQDFIYILAVGGCLYGAVMLIKSLLKKE